MALPSVRVEFRIHLSLVERGVDVQHTLVLARHPSETALHLVLRVVAWCLLHDERLELGPGLSDPDAADLWAHDLTGRLVTWVECGNAEADKLRKVRQHHHGVAVHVVSDDLARLGEVREELEAARGATKRGAQPVVLWHIDGALVASLAENEERRQRWSVTYVGDHLYVDADGRSLDGEVTRSEIP